MFQRTKIDFNKNFGQLKLALSFTWKSSKLWTIFQLVLIVLKAILPLVLLYTWKLLIDQISFGVNSEITFSLNDILWLVVLIGITTFAGAVIEIIVQFVGETQQQLVSDYMYGIIQKHSLKIGLEHYEHPEFLDTFDKAQQEANFRPVQIYNSLLDMTQSLLSLMAIGVLLLYLHWSVAIVLVLTTLPSAYIRFKFVFKLFDWQHKQLEKERKAMYLHSIMTGHSFVQDVRVYGFGDYLREKFRIIRTNIFVEKYAISKKGSTRQLFARASEILAITSIYGFIAFRTVKGILTIGDLVMYFQVFQQGQIQLSKLMQSSVSLYENRLFLDYISRFLDIEPTIKAPSNPTLLPQKLEKGIEVQNITFHYPFTDKTVLQNISMNFPKGELTAIVGENGAGKSTLLKLLCHFYELKKGVINIDGIDMKKVSPLKWRQKISLTAQGYNTYQFSVEENVQLADTHNTIDKKKIRNLASLLELDSVIESFPYKYEQLLGRMFYGGVGLSIGQWKKISLMRAFYRESEVYIMDEPTAGLDPIIEQKVFDALRILAKEKNKVVILVTHHLYNLQLADNIYLLEKGRLMEQGNHQELWDMNGKYKQMVDKQLMNQQSKESQYA